AKIVSKWRVRNRISTLEWPAVSPDLSPTENVWDLLDRKVRRRYPRPRNADELWAALKEEWGNITWKVCQKLTDSMKSRVEACIKARGGATHY
ncbi:hypothetical protein BOTBODRAFT_114624, partial [Botryobasidium botryosum FD-172 SS1]